MYVSELDRPAARGRSNTFRDIPSSQNPSGGATVTAGGGSGTGTNAPAHGFTSPLEAALASVSLGVPSQAPEYPTNQNLGAASMGAPSVRVNGEEMMQYFDIDRLERDRAASDSSGSL